MALVAPLAHAKCPKNAAGVWSGLATFDSFGPNDIYSDKTAVLGRVTLDAKGAFTGTITSRNSGEQETEREPISGTYTFSATTCIGQIDFGGSGYEFLITNNGTVMVGMLVNPRDPTENDVATFTFYRE
jgi:hypothetical protein